MEKPVDAILLWYPESHINFFFFRILAWSLGAVLVADRCEFPFVYLRKTVYVRMKLCLTVHFIHRMLDGIIVISTFLRDYFAANRIKPRNQLLVPILVDPDHFAPAAVIAERTKRKIIYCGNLEHDCEVVGMLRAFGQVATDFPQWYLEVIGPLPERRDAEALVALVKLMGLVERVTFIGAVPRVSIPAQMATGDIMALPRASGIFSTAGLPTKLGEYLATGKPVVITSTGDIPTYLDDQVSAFLVPPNDTAAFGRVLRYVMSHPEEARAVGRRGREVAERQFNSRVHGARIIEFIRSIRRGS